MQTGAADALNSQNIQNKRTQLNRKTNHEVQIISLRQSRQN